MPQHQQLYEQAVWFWPLLLNHLWQATLFALVVALVAWLLKERTAQVRHFVWWLALLKFALPAALLVWAGRSVGVSFFWRPMTTPESFGATRLLRIVEPLAANAGSDRLAKTGTQRFIVS